MPPKRNGKAKSDSPEGMTATSQGTAKELPPRQFIREELEQFGTMGTPNTYFANLIEKNLLFHRENFRMTEDRFNALTQSLSLSQKLLAIAMPYLANFLPRAALDRAGPVLRLNIQEDLNLESWKRMMRAYTILISQILPTITWTEDDNMFPERGIMGLNHTGKNEPMDALATEGPQEWADYAEECTLQGLQYRPVTIHLASQIVDAILDSEPNTEQHMNALFAAAINITHELGHTIYIAIKANVVDYFWVGNDIQAEIGNSLIAYIFNGWYPEPINLEDTYDNEDFIAFRNGHEWHKMHRRPCEEPFAEVMYSMPMEHIQRLFNNETWSAFPRLDHTNFADMRRTIFPPLAPFKIGRHARRAKPLPATGWKFKMAYAGYIGRDEDRDDDEPEFNTFSGSSRREFIDADWDDALTAKDEAVQEERNRRYNMNLNNPAEVIYISSDTEDSKPKKGKEKAGPSKVAPMTKGTKGSTIQTAAKPGTGLGRGRPPRAVTPGPSSTPRTITTTSSGGKTTASGSKAAGNETVAGVKGTKGRPKKSGVKNKTTVDLTTNGGSGDVEEVETPGRPSRKRPTKAAVPKTTNKKRGADVSGNDEELEGPPKKRQLTAGQAAALKAAREKSNPPKSKAAPRRTAPESKSNAAP